MAICIIVDTADDRVRGYCHGDSAVDGTPITCEIGSGCLVAGAGQTRRYYAGDEAAFVAELVTAGAADWSEMDGASYDGTTFGWLGIIPRP